MADLAAAVEAPDAALVEPESVVEAAVAVVAAPSGFAAEPAVPAVFDSVLTAVVCAFAAVLCVFFAALEGTEAAAVLTTASDPDEIKAAVAFASFLTEAGTFPFRAQLLSKVYFFPLIIFTPVAATPPEVK